MFENDGIDELWKEPRRKWQYYYYFFIKFESERNKCVWLCISDGDILFVPKKCIFDSHHFAKACWCIHNKSLIIFFGKWKSMSDLTGCCQTSSNALSSHTQTHIYGIFAQTKNEYMTRQAHFIVTCVHNKTKKFKRKKNLDEKPKTR